MSSLLSLIASLCIPLSCHSAFLLFITGFFDCFLHFFALCHFLLSSFNPTPPPSFFFLCLASCCYPIILSSSEGSRSLFAVPTFIMMAWRSVCVSQGLNSVYHCCLIRNNVMTATLWDVCKCAAWICRSKRITYMWICTGFWTGCVCKGVLVIVEDM